MELAALVFAVVAAAGTAANAYRGGRATTAETPTASLAYARPKPFPSAAPTGQDTVDIRSLDAWQPHPGHEISPRGVVAAFLMAERGFPQMQCDLIEDLIEGDCTARNLFEQREQASAGKPWVMSGQGSDAASALGARILGIALGRLPTIEPFGHLVGGSNRFGWGAVEIDWGIAEIEGEQWIVPTALTCVESRRFHISLDNQLRLIADLQRPLGDELRSGKWIVLKRPGRLARCGLMRTGAWPMIGKRLGWRDWLVYSQRFGLPLPLASYDDANPTDTNGVDVAEEIIRRIGGDGGAVKPYEAKFLRAGYVRRKKEIEAEAKAAPVESAERPPADALFNEPPAEMPVH